MTAPATIEPDLPVMTFVSSTADGKRTLVLRGAMRTGRALVAMVLVACSSPRRADDPAPRSSGPHVLPVDAAVLDAVTPDAILALPPVPALAVEKLAGPFASIRAYCAHAKVKRCDVAPLFTGKRSVATRTFPIALARVVVVEDDLDPSCELAVHDGRAWWVLAAAVRCLGDRAKSTLATKITTLEVTDFVPGGTSELVLRVAYAQSTEDYSPEDFERTRFEVLRVCGVGASGVPSCTREIPIIGRRDEHADGKRVSTSRFAVQTFAAPEQLVIAGDTSGLDKFPLDPLSPGTYALRFD